MGQRSGGGGGGQSGRRPAPRACAESRRRGRRRRALIFNLALLFPLLYSLAALSPKKLTNTFTQVEIIFNSGEKFVVSGSTTNKPDCFTVIPTSQGAALLFAHIATYADAETTLPKGAITVFYDALHVKWSLMQTASKAVALAKLIKSIKHEPFAVTDARFLLSVDAVGKSVTHAGSGSSK